VLIEQVKKERFATGLKARQAPAEDADASISRHIPDAIKREVFERDGGRCTFTDEHGRRCAETGALEFDHRDGFATNTSPPSGRNPTALSWAQPTRRGADVRSRVHGTSARIG